MKKLIIKDWWIVQEKMPSDFFLQFFKYRKIAKIKNMEVAKTIVNLCNNNQKIIEENKELKKNIKTLCTLSKESVMLRINIREKVAKKNKL